MKEKDSKQLGGKVAGSREVKLELGPGDKPVYEDSIKIDRVNLPTVDIVADVEQGLGFLRDDCVDLIYSSHFMEHIANVEFVMREFYRVLRSGGKLYMIVPHFSNPYYYSDYTHSSLWGLYTACLFSKEAYYRRKMPSFYNDLDFKILDIKLSFYSEFAGRYILKKPVQLIVNASRYMQEVYEEIFPYIIPAYEIRIMMQKP